MHTKNGMAALVTSECLMYKHKWTVSSRAQRSSASRSAEAAELLFLSLDAYNKRGGCVSDQECLMDGGCSPACRKEGVC